MVFIIAKTPDDALAMLVKQIDAMVVAQHEKKLAAVVNFLGEADDKTKEKIKEFGEKLALKEVSLVTTADGDKFKISDDAEVTVMIYQRKKVKFNYALVKGGLDQKTIAAIIESVKKMLAEIAEKPKEKEQPKPKPKAKEEPKPQAGVGPSVLQLFEETLCQRWQRSGNRGYLGAGKTTGTWQACQGNAVFRLGPLLTQRPPRHTMNFLDRKDDSNTDA